MGKSGQQEAVEPQAVEQHVSQDAWDRHYDPNTGHYFLYNTQTGESKWEEELIHEQGETSENQRTDSPRDSQPAKEHEISISPDSMGVAATARLRLKARRARKANSQ